MNKRGFIKIIFLILGLLTLALAALGVYGYFWAKNLTPEKIIQNKFVKKEVGEKNQGLLKVLPQLLGFDKPRTYLLLFANNTELRPGGGFIGMYAVVRFNQGKMELLALDGTENLDRQAPKNWQVEPPAVLKENLKVDRWYFRDSNWSPDFVVDAKQALEFYQAEGGVGAGEIEGVLAFTPTVLEELLKITGPFTIQGITFTAENVVEKLEYEVEYGYDDKGIVKTERKQIVKPFLLTLTSHLSDNLLMNFSTYLQLLDKLGQEKQVMAYVADPVLQKAIAARGWSGEVVKTQNSDYLLWVDANLAALKTDHALKRSLRYEIKKQLDGRYLAQSQMTYQHTGKFDWRTTRYRTYARVFVPAGSELVNVDKMKIDQGEELGKKWFGVFLTIEPGQTKDLNFNYFLPENIGKSLDDGSYKLLVQKQLGAAAYGLTLNLVSGKTMNTDLSIDRTFEFKNYAD